MPGKAVGRRLEFGPAVHFMPFRFVCRCGNQTQVTAGQAGTTVRCVCGRVNVVPALGDLRRHARGAELPTADELQVDQSSAAEDPSSPREFLMLLVPDHLLAERISQDALTHLVMAVDRTVRAFFQCREPQQGFDIQVAMALLPDGNRLLDIESQPGAPSDALISDLRRELHDLAVPPVRTGPVAFASRMMVWGGSDQADVSFGFPFSSFLQGQVGMLDDLLMRAGATPLDAVQVTSDAHVQRATSWWSRLRQRVARQIASLQQRRVPADAMTVTEAAPPAGKPGWSPEAKTVEHCTRLLRRHPEYAALYGRRADLYRHQEQYERAIADYSQQIHLEPENANAFASRGECYCCLGNTKQGLADFSRAIRINPRHLYARANRAMIYAELEAWEPALRDLSAAIELDSHNPMLFLERSKIHVMDDNTDQAFCDLSEALRLDPHNDEAYALRGIVDRRCRSNERGPIAEKDQAILDFTASLQINPDNPQAYACRAEVLLGHNEFEKAIADCDQAISMDPECALAWGVRGAAHQCLGNFELAVADCTEAIRLGLQAPQVYVSRAVARDEQDEPELAVEDCATALELDDRYAAAYNSRGLVLMKLGEVDDAIEDLGRAIRLEPDWCLPYFNRGNAYRMRGDLDAAILDYSEAIRLQAEFAPAFLSRGAARLEMTDYDDAIEDLTEAIRLDGELGEAFFHRALAWGYKGNNDKALQDVNRALQQDAELAPAYFTRANIWLARGEYDRAMEDFDQLIRMCPDLGAAYTGRANVWFEKGERERAMEDYREAIQLDPGSAESFTVQRLIVEAAYHHRRENYMDSISLASEALEIDSECAPAFATRAVAHWYSEQHVEATADFTSLIKLGGESLIAYSGRGQVYAEMGEYELALEDLEKAERVAQEAEDTVGLAYTLNGRALVQAGMGKHDDSLLDFDRSIRQCPANAWVYYNLALSYHQRGEPDRARICFRLALRLSDPPLTPRKRARAKAYLRE